MDSKIILIFAFLNAILCGCSSDDEPLREQSIPRTIKWGATIPLTADNYICDNDFVGEIGLQNGVSTFISKHVGKCIVYSPANSNACYSITVTSTSNAFPELDLDFGITHKDFLEKHRRAESTAINPLIITPTEHSKLRYSYSFTDGIYTSVSTILSPGILATNDQTGSSAIEQFLEERYAPAVEEEGVWYNAYSPEKATIKATLDKDANNLYKLTISVKDTP